MSGRDTTLKGISRSFQVNDVEVAPVTLTFEEEQELDHDGIVIVTRDPDLEASFETLSARARAAGYELLMNSDRNLCLRPINGARQPPRPHEFREQMVVLR